MNRSLSIALITVTAIDLLLTAGAFAQQGSDARVADLVNSGKLRVGIALVAPHFAVKDPKTGALRGVSVDVARALAVRLKITFVPVEYRGVPGVLEGLKTNAWDVGFLSVDPSRTNLVDFCDPFQELDVTYVVRAGSSIANVADADRPKIRIVATRNSAEWNMAKGALKQAQLQVVETVNDAYEAIRSGNAEAFAISRPTALVVSGRLPGSRVLADRLGAIQTAMAIPKGQAGHLAYVNEFIEEIKASGLVQESIERNNARGVRALPPGKPK